MNLKATLKDNPMLVFGLVLPFVMVVIFALAGGAFEMARIPPQHDVFFSINYYAGMDKGVKFEVEGDRLVVSAPEGGCHDGQVPKLFRYSA
ncbi:MAG: hypothetical protein J0L97_07400, partial [Alphaproteobacteria bacterium]|nr:hypothetical protein [Alphaproteobacteria bacterium]